MSNVGALDQVRRLVREHPKVHYQAAYTCDTTACIAGWAVALDRGVRVGEDVGMALRALTGREIAETAQTILGLTTAEAHEVFLCATEADALQLVDAIIARDKGEADPLDRTVLRMHCLPVEPAGDPE